MGWVQRLETIHRRLWYAGLRRALRNRPAAVPIDTGRVRKILLLRYDALGDMVVTTPVLEVIRHHLPAARIDVVASPRNVGIIRHEARITRRWIYDGTPRSLWRWASDGGARSLWRVGREARREGYDVVFGLVFSRMTEGGLMANLAGGRDAVKVTVQYPRRAHLYDVFFNLQLPAARERMTMAEIQARLVCDAFGWPFDPALCRSRIELGDENRERAAAFHRATGSVPFVAVNISAGNALRRWSVERNEAFLRALLERHPPIRFVVLSSPADAIEARALAAIDPARIAALPPSSDILDVCAVIELCDIVVTPDTSIVHIATAFGRPVLVLYSRLASFAEWMPYGVPYRAVVTRERRPLDSISPQEAVDAFGELYRGAGDGDLPHRQSARR